MDKSPALELTSPSDMVGPSPVTSNGTETTEIEDDEHDQIEIVEDSDGEEQEQDTRPRSDVPVCIKRCLKGSITDYDRTEPTTDAS